MLKIMLPFIIHNGVQDVSNLHLTYIDIIDALDNDFIDYL